MLNVVGFALLHKPPQMGDQDKVKDISNGIEGDAACQRARPQKRERYLCRHGCQQDTRRGPRGASQPAGGAKRSSGRCCRAGREPSSA